MSDKPVFVTRPYLPPLDEFLPLLREIWDTRVLTNGGKFHQQLEWALEDYLGVDNISLLSNGTTALMIALRALGVTGEVITTPYTFVATAHSLLWCGLSPVFADIDPDTMNLAPDQVRKHITPRTSAILAVHCYGYPCDVDQLQMIADEYGLKLIYDAAHAFGVAKNNKSILSYGDISTLSFHATKVFNTFEGGAIVCRDARTKAKVDLLKNFGFISEERVVEPGFNAKMNEVQAALGLVQLKHIDETISQRRRIDTFYRENLAGIPGIKLPPLPNGCSQNYSYFPILLEPDFPLTRDELYERLKARGIFARKYFYPTISEFEMYRSLPTATKENLPEANRIASSVLCLPIFPELELDMAMRIVNSIGEAGR
jgi:dTDP-4-amino-4,6-dideoxygalactose transaminase